MNKAAVVLLGKKYLGIPNKGKFENLQSRVCKAHAVTNKLQERRK
jgi:hypothetical protein